MSLIFYAGDITLVSLTNPLAAGLASLVYIPGSILTLILEIMLTTGLLMISLPFLSLYLIYIIE